MSFSIGFKGGLLSSTILQASSLIFIVFIILNYVSKRSKVIKAPIFGDSQQAHFHDLLWKAAKESKDEPFSIKDANGESTIILPRKYVDDVKSLPEDNASFNASAYRHFAGKYTGIGSDDLIIKDAVKIDLTRNIARTLDGLQDEANYAIPEAIGLCEEWTEVPFYPKVARIVAHMTGRTFVGLPLCRNEQWIQSTIDYTFDCFAAVVPVDKMNPLLRPLYAFGIPEVKRIFEHRNKGSELLKPVLEERLEAMRNRDYIPPLDLIQFVINRTPEKEKMDILKHSFRQMLLSMAAIHTTAMNVTHVLYDLCAHPEFIQPLREEIEETLAADGGKFVKTSMIKLKKLDSVLRESQRFNAPSMTTLGREAVKKVVLHDGFVIPAGSLFAFSAISVNFDPSMYPDPMTWDGFRFAKLRELPENANKYQFVTTSLDAMNFGHGTHACPGRFFASNEIKIILAGILTTYDFGFRKDGGVAKRPKNIYSKATISPDMSAKIWFKKKSVI